MKPTKNAINSNSEFKTQCLRVRALVQGPRITDQAMRYLRLALIETVSTQEHLPEALAMIFKALAGEGVRKIEPKHFQSWIAPKKTDASSSDDDEAEAADAGDLSGEELNSIRKVLDSFRDPKTKVTYLLVDWKPSWQPRENLSQTLVANFAKERRALVRKTYIEYEAKEDNSLNPQ